jgi:hypothetical protein
MPLLGESFRYGGQGCRNRGGKESVPRQKLATYSHLRFIKYMKKEKNIDVDVVFITYKENQEEINALERWYKDYLVHSVYFDTKCQTEVELFELAKCVLRELNIQCLYDYIFLMRFDFYIKEVFQNSLFKLNPLKVIYCYRDLYGYRGENNWEYVGHYCMIVPNYFFNLITDGELWTSKHKTFEYISSLKGPDSYEIIVETPHWSSSCLGYNPFFTMVGRSDYNKYDVESEKHKDAHNYIFNTDIYNNLINTDTLDENLSKFSFSELLTVDDIPN